MTAPSKDALRGEALARRARAHGEADPAPAQRALVRFLAALPPGPVAGYLPMRSEIDPLPALTESGRAILLPAVLAPRQPLEFRPWAPGEPLEDGPFGTRHPRPGPAPRPAIVVVPLLAFDRSGGRLGYGGGFYDRTLAALGATGPLTAVGFAYAAQEVEEVPTGEFDVALDAVVTEAGVVAPPC